MFITIEFLIQCFLRPKGQTRLPGFSLLGFLEHPHFFSHFLNLFNNFINFRRWQARILYHLFRNNVLVCLPTFLEMGFVDFQIRHRTTASSTSLLAAGGSAVWTVFSCSEQHMFKPKTNSIWQTPCFSLATCVYLANQGMQPQPHNVHIIPVGQICL